MRRRVVLSIVVAMGLVLGNSQTMKTAWIGDTLGLIPPIVFLVAVHFEKKGSTRDFPFVTAEWARRWPSEHVFKAVKRG